MLVMVLAYTTGVVFFFSSSETAPYRICRTYGNALFSRSGRARAMCERLSEGVERKEAKMMKATGRDVDVR